jgi:hypothetical protein
MDVPAFRVLAPVAAALAVVAPRAVFAHCDTLDGPVVAAARQALEQNNPNLALIWVKKDQEPAIRTAFEKALSVRKLNPAANDVADTSFFETLVRLHRAGEGAAYTGLKPAGTDMGPAIPAADKAIASGDVAPVAKLLTERMQAGLADQFRKVQALKSYDKNDVAAGREYVEAYVVYVHYVEALYNAAQDRPQGHYPEQHAAGPGAGSATGACNVN